MKRCMALMALALWMPSAFADDCKNRIIRLASPMFPQTLQQFQILEQEKRCVIDTAFSINGDGRAENIEYRSPNPACKPFNVSAIRAIRNSVFTPGPYLRVCFLTVTFEIVDGRPRWRYD